MSAVYLEYIYLGLDLLIGCSGRSSPSEKGGGRGRAGHPDPEIRGGQSQNIFFRPFGPHFGQSIRGEPGPPAPLPWIRHWAVVSSL